MIRKLQSRLPKRRKKLMKPLTRANRQRRPPQSKKRRKSRKLELSNFRSENVNVKNLNMSVTK